MIEFALSRLHSRYGISIDDILIDSDQAVEYEKMVHEAAPRLTSMQIRLAALYLRKTRSITKKDAHLVASLDPSKIEASLTNLGAVAEIRPAPEGPGLIELLENDKPIYISRRRPESRGQRNLQRPLAAFMANDFWTPDPERLVVRIFEGDRFLKASISNWQLRLISVRNPVFNWPVRAEAA